MVHVIGTLLIFFKKNLGFFFKKGKLKWKRKSLLCVTFLGTNEARKSK